MTAKRKKVLILAGISWDDTWQRHQQIAEILADSGAEVTFFERIPSSKLTLGKVFSRLKSFIARKLSGSGAGGAKSNRVVKGVRRFRKFLLPPRNRLVSVINSHIICRKILPELSCGNSGGYDYDLIINYLPAEAALEIVSSLKYGRLWYDCVRAFSVWGGYPESVAETERCLFDISDKVLVDSFYLKDYAENKTGNEPVHLLPFVEESDYRIAEENFRPVSEISSLAYFGSIDEHIDLDLLRTAADSGKTVNFYGRLYLPEKEIEHENFEFHGYFPSTSEMFKAILDRNDAVIIPYRGSMDGVIPAKMLQSLAMLRPVFISDFYDSRKLDDMCFVYKTETELMEMLLMFDAEEYENKRLPLIRSFVENNFESGFRRKVLNLFNQI